MIIVRRKYKTRIETILWRKIRGPRGSGVHTPRNRISPHKVKFQFQKKFNSNPLLKRMELFT